MPSHIEWTDETWNPVTGCTRVSDGCTNCYIERTPPFRMAHRTFGSHDIGATTGVKRYSERLHLPLRWRKPRRIFVNSLSDLFHEDIPDAFIAEVFGVMAAAPHHTFQVLTKRHARMRSLLSSTEFDLAVAEAWSRRSTTAGSLDGGDSTPPYPLPNVWLGVSVENQQWAGTRIPALLETPAAVRWISAEPLLGPVDLRNLRVRDDALIDCLGGDVKSAYDGVVYSGTPSVLDWVVAGGESGPGARPMHPGWVHFLRDQCQAAGVPYLFKQWGEWRPQPLYSTDDRHHVVMPDGRDRGTPWSGWGIDQPDAEVMERVGKKRAGRELGGRTWDEYPQAVTA